MRGCQRRTELVRAEIICDAHIFFPPKKMTKLQFVTLYGPLKNLFCTLARAASASLTHVNFATMPTLKSPRNPPVLPIPKSKPQGFTARIFFEENGCFANSARPCLVKE